jgi:phosphatidylglycerophosphatase A
MSAPGPEERMREPRPSEMHARAPLSSWHPVSLAATWFGSGLLPWLPGTWGSLAALPFAWVIVAVAGNWGLVVAMLVVFAAGCWASGIYARYAGISDPGAIVIDEVVGQWAVLLVVPQDVGFYLLAFLIFRTFDIWKPWPIRWVDRYVKGGLGVMLDDLVAGVYGVPAMAGLVWILTT